MDGETFDMDSLACHAKRVQEAMEELGMLALQGFEVCCTASAAGTPSQTIQMDWTEILLEPASQDEVKS